MSARRRLTVLLAGITVATAAVPAAAAEEPVPGSQGTDTSLPATDSQITVNGRGRFVDLSITVNQTENLTNQAVSITWSGGSLAASAIASSVASRPSSAVSSRRIRGSVRGDYVRACVAPPQIARTAVRSAPARCRRR